MPQYTVKAPNGRSVTLTGDAPPSEADLDEIFSKIGPAELPTHPASAEDFAPTAPEPSFLDSVKQFASGLGKSVDPRAALKLLYDAGTGIGGALSGQGLAQGDALTEDLKGIGRAHLDQFTKAKQAYDAGRYSEAIGHTMAGAVPLFGPAMGAAGEQIGSGDIAGGLGTTTGILATAEAPRVLGAAGDVAAGAGRLASKVPVAKLAKPAAVAAGGALGHAVGGPFGAAAGAIMAKEILGSVLDKAGEVPASNAGGRLAGKAPTVESAIADALDAVRQEPPAPAGTTPPQPDLPPGYQPRTTLPRAARAVPEPVPAEAPKRSYFLRSPEDIAASKAAAAETLAMRGDPENIATADLPASWRGRVTQNLLGGMGDIKISDLAEGFAQELRDRGLSTRDAIDAVTKNAALDTATRLQIVEALKHAGGMK